MKAKSIGALLISGLFAFSAFFASAPASASDFDDEKDSSQSVESPSPFQSSRPKPTSKSVESYQLESDDEDDDDEFDQRVKKKYGSRDHLSVPPLVVRPSHDDDEDDDGYVAEAEATDESTSKISSAGRSVLQSETLSVTTPQLSSIATNSGTVAAVAGSSLQTTQNIQTGQKMDLTQVKIQSKTPAERFMDAALVGLAAMGAGAIGLGAMASSKALRRR
jgi:hypothetical protein